MMVYLEFPVVIDVNEPARYNLSVHVIEAFVRRRVLLLVLVFDNVLK